MKVPRRYRASNNEGAVQRKASAVGKRSAVASRYGSPPGPVQQRRAGGPASEPEDVHATAERGVSGTASPLPFAAAIQQSFGRHDVSGVEAHLDQTASEAAGDMGATAFATGQKVAFRGSPDLHTTAHEAAHVVQQRGGVSLKGGVGEVGDLYEQHADAVADAVVRGDSAEELLTAMAGGPTAASASGGVQRSVQMENDTASTTVSGTLAGHASPRWERPRGGSRAELNLRLSADRVDTVRTFFEAGLGNALRERGVDCNFDFTCRTVDDQAAAPATSAPPLTSEPPAIGGEARGHTDTEVEAGGNTRANDRAMRRVDLVVTLTWNVSGESGMSTSEDVTIPRECAPNATERWAVKLSLSGGGGHAGVGAAGALGTLKNRLTGQTAQGSFQGGGLGVGLSTPGADPGWGDWNNFTTDRPVTFEDFDGTLARLTTLGAGIAIIGYSFAYLSFPSLGANSISVGGANMGALGADGGSNVGWWNVIGTPPGAQCTPERTETREVTEMSPYEYSVPNQFRHTVYFDTGSAEISDEQLTGLQLFADRIAETYQWPGPNSQADDAGVCE